MNVFRTLAVSMLLVAPISTESSEVKTIHDAQIDTMLDRWQARLGLGDWHIEAEIVAPGTLGIDEDGSSTVADIVYDTSRRSATIRVQRAANDEVEEALLHELMHLKLAAWQPPVSSDDEEQTVDSLAYALLASKAAE